MHRAASGTRKSSTGPVATRPHPCGPMQPHRSPSPSPPDSTVGNRSHDPASRLASTPLIGMTLNYAVAGDALLAGRHAHSGAEIRNRRGSRRQRSGNNESGRSGKATYSAASARLTGSFQSASRDPGNPSVRSRTTGVAAKSCNGVRPVRGLICRIALCRLRAEADLSGQAPKAHASFPGSAVTSAMRPSRPPGAGHRTR